MDKNNKMSKNLLGDSDKLIISNLLDQVEHYILELGEFYPFGAFLNNKQITPFSIYNGSNYPSVEEMIVEYSKFAEDGIIKNNFQLCGIAIEVFINGKNGVLIKLFSQTDPKEITVFYTINGNIVDFHF